jgi:hypothetical protein
MVLHAHLCTSTVASPTVTRLMSVFDAMLWVQGDVDSALKRILAAPAAVRTLLSRAHVLPQGLPADATSSQLLAAARRVPLSGEDYANARRVDARSLPWCRCRGVPDVAAFAEMFAFPDLVGFSSLPSIEDFVGVDLGEEAGDGLRRRRLMVRVVTDVTRGCAMSPDRLARRVIVTGVGAHPTRFLHLWQGVSGGAVDVALALRVVGERVAFACVSAGGVGAQQRHHHACGAGARCCPT